MPVLSAVKLTVKDEQEQSFHFHHSQNETYGADDILADQESTRLGSISLKSVFDYSFPPPPLPPPKVTAHILGTMDDKIELNRRMNTKQERMPRHFSKAGLWTLPR